MSLADNIRRYRERKNITQKELAETVGITQQALSLFEQGVKVPGIITAVDIAKTLDTTVEQLVDGQTAENKNVKSTRHFETQEVKKDGST